MPWLAAYSVISTSPSAFFCMWRAGGTVGFSAYFLPSNGSSASYGVMIPPPATRTDRCRHLLEEFRNAIIGGCETVIFEIRSNDAPLGSNTKAVQPPLPHQ